MTDCMKTVLNKTQKLQTGLKSVLDYSEERFMNLSQDLQAVYLDTKSLADLTTETIKKITEKTGDHSFADIEQMIQSSLEEFRNNKNEAEESLTSLLESSSHLGRLHSLSSVIRRLAKNLNIISINIGVESSRSNSYDYIKSFSNEIKSLSFMVTDTADEIRDNSESANSIQMKTYNEIRGKLKQSTSVKANANQEIKTSLAGINELIDTSAGKLDDAGEHLNRINLLVDQVIEAIQFHDISRQQIEHILDAVAAINSQCCSDVNKEDNEKKATEVFASFRLQSAQINQVVQQFDDIQAKISNAFHELNNEIHMVVSSLSYLNENQGYSRDPFSSLKDNLSKISTLLAADHEINSHVTERINESSDLINGFSKHTEKIKDIGFDLHIKAINAVILSMKLGQDGKALAVLAQEVTKISLESDKFVEEVADILQTISELGKSLISSSANLKHDNINIIENYEKSILFVDDIQNNLTRESAITNDNSLELKNKIAEIGSELSFLEELKNSLTSFADDMNESVNELIELYPELNNAAVENDSMSGIYTMDIEREIHRQIYSENDIESTGTENGTEPDDDSQKGTSPAENSEDDFGDNIELF